MKVTHLWTFVIGGISGAALAALLGYGTGWSLWGGLLAGLLLVAGGVVAERMAKSGHRQVVD